jgi:hypothetical protein
MTRPDPLMTTEAWGFAILALGVTFVCLGHLIGLDTQTVVSISSTIIGSGCTVFTSAVKTQNQFNNSPNSNASVENSGDVQKKV